MTDGTNCHHPGIARTERGPVIAETRKTLYQVMDYVTAGWPPKLIRDWMDLTDEQIQDVMEYIAEHSAEVEAEYQQVLRDAEEERRYWEERNRERFAEIAKMPRDPEYAAIHAKIDAARAQREQRNHTEADPEWDHPTVMRTDRGLTIAGSRMTVFDVMDYVTADWPPKLIRNWLGLTDKQIRDVMEYICPDPARRIDAGITPRHHRWESQPVNGTRLPAAVRRTPREDRVGSA